MQNEFDLVVLGAGSGGIAAANRAAEYGAKVAIIESDLVGGTCVNVGCVPKKIMWMASHTQSTLKQVNGLGFEPISSSLDWSTLVKKRQDYIHNLHGLYERKFNNNKITFFKGYGKFVDNHTVEVDGKILKGSHILISTGSQAMWPDIPGKEFGIDSNGFFELTQQPKRVAVVGAGYIAVEIAGMLNAFGSEVSLVFRKDKVLRSFDHTLSQSLLDLYQSDHMQLYPNHTPESLKRTAEGLILHCQNQAPLPAVDVVIWAIGRDPNVKDLNLSKLPIEQNSDGSIVVDEYQNTSQQNVYAIGDVTGKWPLTPVAIKAGRLLSDRLFNQKNVKLNYEFIPTVIFSHPPIGTVGLSEQQANEQFGEDQLKIYQAKFTPMTSSFSVDKTPFLIKLITHKSSDKILGCHIMGDAADEMLQGFAVAIKMGATKADFDSTVAIHPTISEELVTLR